MNKKVYSASLMMVTVGFLGGDVSAESYLGRDSAPAGVVVRRGSDGLRDQKAQSLSQDTLSESYGKKNWESIVNSVRAAKKKRTVGGENGPASDSFVKRAVRAMEGLPAIQEKDCRRQAVIASLFLAKERGSLSDLKINEENVKALGLTQADLKKMNVAFNAEGMLTQHAQKMPIPAPRKTILPVAARRFSLENSKGQRAAGAA